MGNKFILGGGISGLLYAFYNRDFTIISPDLGGKLNNPFFENIFYLHATDDTKQFLKDININYVEKTQLIKYVKNGSIIKSLAVEDKVSFIKKKLNDPEFEPVDLNLSTSDYYISVFEINYTDLLAKLKRDLCYIEDSVIKITDTEIVTETTRYRYNSIVSTINAKFFWNIYHKRSNLPIKKLESKPVTFVLADKLPDSLQGQKFDLVYFVSSDEKIVRVSKRRRDQQDVFLYEFSERISREEAAKLLPEGSAISSCYTDEDGLIYTNANNIAPKNVIFAGRFATWNHSDKQQDVLKVAKTDFELQNIWNIQKSFTNNFVDFNQLNDNSVRQKFTKDYFLALIPELAEVLNEINYKQHKQHKKINRDMLLEEMIDTFKYYLNILLMWDVTPEEFLRVFKAKSQKVSNQYESNK